MGGTPETSQLPCPHRIIEDAGQGFVFGLVIGSAIHFLKGIHNSPKGISTRLVGGSHDVIMNAPHMAGWVGAFSTVFSTVDCTLVYTRQKEDPWNSIIAGATAYGLNGFFYYRRQGLRPFVRGAALGGTVFALIEGLGVVMNKLLYANIPEQAPPTLTLTKQP